MGSGVTWEKEEDEALSRAWVAASEDAITGTCLRKQAGFGSGYSRFMLRLSQMGRIAPQRHALLDGKQSINM